MKTKFIKNPTVSRIIWISMLLLIWQGVALSKVFSPLIFPTIDVVLKALYVSILSGEIINQTLLSLLLIGQGLLIGVVLALVMASLSMLSHTVKGLVDTLISIADPLPGIALLPLIILWLGTGTPSIVFVIVHSVMWPMALNTLAGFKSIPKIYKEVGENYGLPPHRIIGSIMIPASLPYLLSGIKVSWARAWRSLISAEMVFGAAGGRGGLGWFIFKNRVFMDTPGMYAGLIVIIIIGMVVEDFVFNKIEEATIKKWGMSV